jgi:hypothetical protein
MKKIILTLICITTVTAGAWAQSAKKTDVEKDGLKGGVKNIATNYYQAIDKFGVIEKGRKLLSDTLFVSNDEEHEIVYKLVFDFDVDKLLAKYDKQGKITKYINGYYGEGNFAIDVVELKYENNNKTITFDTKKHTNYSPYTDEPNFDGWAPLNKRKMVYNDLGLVVEDCYYHYNGTIERKQINKYDTQGNIIESYEYNSKGDLSQKTIYKYDTQGNVLEKSNYNSEGNITKKIIYNDLESVCYSYGYRKGMAEKDFYEKYNKKHNIIKREEYAHYDRKDSLCTKYTYRYDDREKLIEECHYSYKGCYGNTSDSEIKNSFIYDDKGNLTKKICEYQHREKEIKTYEYKYDSKGNWTWKTMYEGEAKLPVIIAERIIEYYE